MLVTLGSKDFLFTIWKVDNDISMLLTYFCNKRCLGFFTECIVKHARSMPSHLHLLITCNLN